MNTQRGAMWSNGFALFSMFFGAGNITFPLAIGLAVQGGLWKALIGLVFTAVLIPFSGLISITLFDGDYKAFFYRLGKIPGFAIIALLMALIGPFCGIPRCITLTYSTLHVAFPGLTLFTFSLLACLLIFMICSRRSKIVGFIGYFLTPLLLFFLTFIIVKGLFFSPHESLGEGGMSAPFFYGLAQGYNTMDLLASFFFSSLVCQRLKDNAPDSDIRTMLASVLKACLIGASLLSIVYVGFSYVAAFYAQELAGTSVDHLLGKLGHIVLGPSAGLVVCMSIALTCLTTAIALTVITAEFLRDEICFGKIPYSVSIFLVMATSFLVSTLEFMGIVNAIAPLLHYLYPMLLIFCLLSIAVKVYKLNPKTKEAPAKASY